VFNYAGFLLNNSWGEDCMKFFFFFLFFFFLFLFLTCRFGIVKDSFYLFLMTIFILINSNHVSLPLASIVIGSYVVVKGDIFLVQSCQGPPSIKKLQTRWTTDWPSLH
jgi:hypothetical protein